MEKNVPKRSEFETGDHYIDGDLAHLIACVKEWGDFATFREASEKVARLLQQAPVGTLVMQETDVIFWTVPTEPALTIDHLPGPNGSAARPETSTGHSEK